MKWNIPVAYQNWNNQNGKQYYILWDQVWATKTLSHQSSSNDTRLILLNLEMQSKRTLQAHLIVFLLRNIYFTLSLFLSWERIPIYSYYIIKPFGPVEENIYRWRYNMKREIKSTIRNLIHVDKYTHMKSLPKLSFLD